LILILILILILFLILILILFLILIWKGTPLQAAEKLENVCITVEERPFRAA